MFGYGEPKTGLVSPCLGNCAVQVDSFLYVNKFPRFAKPLVLLPLFMLVYMLITLIFGLFAIIMYTYNHICMHMNY